MGSKNNHSVNHKKAYVAVWLTLLALTVLTVWVSYHNYGVWNIAVAMLLATIKASLVCLYCMHLPYHNQVDKVVFVSSFVFLAIFVGLTASDVLERPVKAQAKVHEIQGPVGDVSAKMNELRKETPQLVAKGKELFQVNCV